MRSSDLRYDENYYEFLRLSQDSDYTDVTYDEESGGVSAVHKYHKFDKQKGLNGLRRGDYERLAVDVLRKNGHRIVLESEMSSHGIKKCDGLLDDIQTEIKAVEGTGVWTICTKLRDAEKQKAQCVVLFFPQHELYSQCRVSEGIRLYRSSPDNPELQELSCIQVIVEEEIVACWDKKATPIEGWSIEEGLRGQNGASPLTIPPSDAKV